MFTKGDVTDKENYRPVSIKPLQKLIYKQMFEFRNPKLSKNITVFQKSRSTQHGLLKMMETWRSTLNCEKKVNILLRNLSKAFDTLNHHLLLSKLKAYDFKENSVTFIRSILQIATNENWLHFQ